MTRPLLSRAIDPARRHSTMPRRQTIRMWRRRPLPYAYNLRRRRWLRIIRRDLAELFR